MAGRITSLRTASLLLALALTGGACSEDTPARRATGTTSPVACTNAAKTEQKALPTAPASRRVDLIEPRFSNPTEIDNKLFPISSVSQLLQVGTVDGLPFRSEATLLRTTKNIPDAGGRLVETAIVQYVAYLDDRIHEVALDWYAQADDGAVWYFGEDVFNYEEGRVADTEGTWISCKDGPPGMIMPADPKPGNVYRPENIPGYVFEEVTVQKAGVVARGPLGPVSGALVVRELHMEGTYESKTFAPGYGEFITGGGGDSEVAAVAVPTDATGAPTPAELQTISSESDAVFAAAGSKRWTDAKAGSDRLATAWRTHLAKGPVNALIKPILEKGVVELGKAIGRRDVFATRQAALDVGRANLDLQMYHRPLTEIDLDRTRLWASQVLVDTAAKDVGATRSTVVILELLWARVGHAAPIPTNDSVTAAIKELRTAADAKQLSLAGQAAERLLAALA